MSWLSILFWILTNAPQLITQFKKFLDLIHTFPGVKKQAVLAEATEAVKLGDGHLLEKIFHRECNGTACVPDLK